MTKMRPIKTAVLTFAASSATLFLFAQTAPAATNQPIGFRYISTGQFNNGGYVSVGTTFWATNHTTNTLLITLSAIEIKAGSNWTTQARPYKPLQFRLPGSPFTESFLQPHAARYATVQLFGLQFGGIWRARVTVNEQLTGAARTTANLKKYPELLQRRYALGQTNIPMNPFSTNISFFKRATEVLSQEVGAE
jgi:hypothetical protein